MNVLRYVIKILEQEAQDDGGASHWCNSQSNNFAHKLVQYVSNPFWAATRHHKIFIQHKIMI